jgi:putative transposase
LLQETCQKEGAKGNQQNTEGRIVSRHKIASEVTVDRKTSIPPSRSAPAARYPSLHTAELPLLLLLASSTDSDLAKQVEYLKAENGILRKRIDKRLYLTTAEKRLLVKLGLAIGKGIGALLTVVAYPTFRRWVGLYEPAAAGTKPKGARGKGGRPRTPDETRELVLRLARENDWGYTRILGELRKLSTTKISRSTVVNILRENDSTKGTWADFLKSHAQSLWQCDFFSKNIVTAAGIRQCFVLAFIHVQTRRVWLSPWTFKPDAPWMTEQAEGFLVHAKTQGLAAGVVLRDRDSKYTTAFDGALEAGGVTVTRVGYRSPNQNAYVERFVQAIERECLDRFIVFGREHLDHVCREYVEYYHIERPHQGMGNRPLTGSAAMSTVGEVLCGERLGGVLRHYHRAVAA